MTGMMTRLVGYMINQEPEGLSRRILRLSHTHRIPRIIMGGATAGGALYACMRGATLGGGATEILSCLDD